MNIQHDCCSQDIEKMINEGGPIFIAINSEVVQNEVI